MSQARLYPTKSRKVYTCTKCREDIPKGSQIITFAVGFRGRDQRRRDTAACRPTRAERESSAVATVYEVQDSLNLDSSTSYEDLNNMVLSVAEACTEVAGEYESNEMFEINEDLQERADILNSAADELQGWDDSLEEEPEQEDGELDKEFQARYDEWLDEAISTAEACVAEVELP